MFLPYNTFMHNVITLKSPLYVIHLHENHFSKKNAKKNKGFHALHFLAPRFGAPNFFNHLTRCTSSMKKTSIWRAISRVESFYSANNCSLMKSTGICLPVHNSKASAPCQSIIPRPLIAVAPTASACSISLDFRGM